ncbi:MAG TPA: AraC family transcriptional regulator [Blastocatellia bacterium]|nr:AraC family transcriptional regulator [Blastocatellia bacterium]
MAKKSPEARIFVRTDYTIEQRRLGKVPVDRISSDYTIIAILDGDCRITTNGETDELHSGSIILLNPNQTCSIAAAKNLVEALFVFLPAVYVYQVAGRLQPVNNSELLFRELSFNGTDRAQFLVETISEELSSDAAGRTVVIDATISQLTVYLLRNMMNARRSLTLELSRVGVVDRRLRRAIEFMHLRSAEELSLSAIASEAFLSAYHFARLFKRLTGQTPHNYLANIRIDRAKQLLATSDLPISSIASQVGYENQSHFAKLFRSSTGLTPKEYRAGAIQRQ